jgi:2-polyprenyl-3-methyl-5-hydroxy-6-metoxy-1,4-benzoquinol methylase
MAEFIKKCPVCGKTGFLPFLAVKDHFFTKEVFSIQECETCGFKFVNPRPDKDEIGRYYQSDEYISHDSTSRSLLSQIYRFARIFSVKSKYKIVKRYALPGKILDIGCGTGEFLNFCKSKGLPVEGVEPNDKARTYAWQVNQIPVNSQLNEHNIGKGSCRCITMWHVLEHVHNLDDTLETVKNLLTDDGVFIVAVPNSNSWDARKFGEFWAAYDVPRHLYHFTALTMRALATNHGFEIWKMIPQKLDAFYVSMLSEKYRTGKTKYLKFLFFGLWSNFQSRKQGRGHSSQIFVLSVKKT